MRAGSLLSDHRRLAVLDQLAILDTPPEPDYDDLAALAAVVCGSSVGAVNFVDASRHYTKAISGLPEAQSASVSNDLSFCAATVQSTDGVLIIPDTHLSEDWRTSPIVNGDPRVRFYAGAAVEIDGERVGVVCCFDTRPRRLGATEQAGLQALSRLAAGQLDLRRRNAELGRLASTDPLTGLVNRRVIGARLKAELDPALAARDTAVGVLFCDFDDFKAFNDYLGHEVGDRLLCEAADRLRDLAPPAALVGRIAGDEFVVIAPGMDAGRLETLAEEVRAIVFTRPGPGLPAPALSVGAALGRPGESPTEVMRRADAAMYAEKAGRGELLSVSHAAATAGA